MPNKELKEEHQAFISALIEHRGDITLASQAVNITPRMGYYLMRRLKEEIIAAAEHVLALNSVRAAFRLEDGMNGTLEIGANNVIESAKQVLDRVGVVKKEKLEVSASPGIFILPAKCDQS